MPLNLRLFAAAGTSASTGGAGVSKTAAGTSTGTGGAAALFPPAPTESTDRRSLHKRKAAYKAALKVSSHAAPVLVTLTHTIVETMYPTMFAK